MVWYVAVATHDLTPCYYILFIRVCSLLPSPIVLFDELRLFVRLGFVVEGTSANGCVEDRPDPAR